MIDKSKKRYNLSLEREVVENFKQLANELKMPSGMMSAVCNDIIRDTTKLLQKAKDEGKLTITDLFVMMGKEIQKITEEEKHDAGLRSENLHKGKTVKGATKGLKSGNQPRK